MNYLEQAHLVLEQHDVNTNSIATERAKNKIDLLAKAMCGMSQISMETIANCALGAYNNDCLYSFKSCVRLIASMNNKLSKHFDEDVVTEIRNTHEAVKIFCISLEEQHNL